MKQSFVIQHSAKIDPECSLQLVLCTPADMFKILRWTDWFDIVIIDKAIKKDSQPFLLWTVLPVKHQCSSVTTSFRCASKKPKGLFNGFNEQKNFLFSTMNTYVVLGQNNSLDKSTT